MLLPWWRIDRFQSLAVSRPEMYWNSFGVIHVSCYSPLLRHNFLQSNLEEIDRNRNAFLCQLFRKFLWQTSLEPDARSF